MALNRLPVIGPWKAKLTKIEKLAMVSCVPNPIALVYGQAVAGFNVVWTVIQPDCIDTAYDRFRGRHRTKRQAAMQGQNIYTPSYQPKGELQTTLVKFGDLAQMIGFYFALIDGLLDGVIYGTSLVYRYSGCVVPGAAHYQAHLTNTVPLLYPAQTSLIAFNLDSVSAPFVAGPLGPAWPAGEVDFITVVMWLQQGFNKVPPLKDCSFTSRIINLFTAETLRNTNPFFQRPTNIMNGGYAQDYNAQSLPGELVVEVTKTEGVMYIEDGGFVVQAGRYKPPFKGYKCGTSIGGAP